MINRCRCGRGTGAASGQCRACTERVLREEIRRLTWELIVERERSNRTGWAPSLPGPMEDHLL